MGRSNSSPPQNHRISEHVNPDSTKDGFRRTLIQIREKQYHQLLVRYGMERLGMPGTLISRIRGEFFKGGLNVVIKALRSIGQGDLYLFTSNNINSIQKLALTKEDIPEDARPSFLPGEYNVQAGPVTEQIPVRKSPRFDQLSFLRNIQERRRSNLSPCHIHNRRGNCRGFDAGRRANISCN